MLTSLRETSQKLFGRAPPWTPLYLHLRSLERYMRARVPEVLRQSGERVRVLDVGCGSMPYRAIFEADPRCLRYDGADVPSAGAAPSVQIDPQTQTIGAPAASYDLVVTFQTLEHVARPFALLEECKRVLRPGGVLFATVPFLFEGHGVPGDYRRWTPDGFSEDLAVLGFTGMHAEPIEKDLESLVVVNQLYAARHLGHYWTKPLFMALNATALALTHLAPSHPFHMLPLTIGATARKPE